MNPESPKKRIILLMIDTLIDDSIQAAIKEEKIPALQFFMEHGFYSPDVVSPFPTMSVTADSTLVTGVNCDKHKVPGLVWFNKKENRIVNYGSSNKEMLKLGVGQSILDTIYNLNHEHLSSEQPTIYESLNAKGNQTASINGLLYRGSKRHQWKNPLMLSSFPGMEKELNTNAPDIISYGLFTKQKPLFKHLFALKKYGFNDKFSVNELNHLIRNDKLPPFTFVYLPDFDQRVHRNGVTDIKGLQKVDKQLQRILNEFDSWEEALSNNIWIILGDHGQTNMKTEKKKALIHLPKLLENYRITKLSKGVTPDDDIVLGINQKMSYIYSLKPETISLEKIADIMKNDNRIDVIAFQNGKNITVMSGTTQGELHFRPGGPYMDGYGQSWHIEGDNGILDIKITNRQLLYKDYPDPLERIFTALHSHEGDYIVACAKPGYEFKGESSSSHVCGASHGGLHKQDSLVSMIICGTRSTPEYLRTVDLKEWIESLV